MPGLWNTTLWGDLLPGGATDDLPGNLDTNQVIDGILPDLHAINRADLAPWWSEAELYQFLDEALKRLSRVACVFVGRQGALPLTVAGQFNYALPPQHVATLHISYATTPLRPGNQLELEMRDPDFQTAPGTPDHWYEDLLGMEAFGVTPVPDTSDVPMPVIYEGWPTEIDAGGKQSFVAAPPPLKGYLGMCILAEAYGNEGEMEAPDIAKHCRGRMDLYEQAFRTYYGAGM